MSTSSHNSDQAGLVKLAAQTYVYGYPLVYNLREIGGFAIGQGSLPFGAPINQFGFAKELLGPETTFVSPNNDTSYVIAACDVRSGPVVLNTPDSDGRYYVLQFVDAWTNNFAYVGRRSTGTSEASYLLAAEDWVGETPEGMTRISAPTGLFVIVGRVQVDGEEDLPAVHKLVEQFTLSTAVGNPQASPKGVPVPDGRVPDELMWWERFRVALAEFPPAAADGPFVDAAAQFGLTSPESPYVDPDPELAKVLVAGASAGQEMIENIAKGDGLGGENGWISAMHMFDYNLDHLGLGTIDRKEWKIDDRARAYAIRAGAARAGLWGNHGYEAVYSLSWVDDGGEPLDGSGSEYELRLDPPPPVDAFWSLTMYDATDFYLVANPINRYAIGDQTPGLVTNADGSVTIYIQHKQPDPDKLSNWLPAPDGRFRPLMRMYQPREEILGGTYSLGPIVKTHPPRQS